jgi:hypothetical protein
MNAIYLGACRRSEWPWSAWRRRSIAGNLLALLCVVEGVFLFARVAMPYVSNPIASVSELIPIWLQVIFTVGGACWFGLGLNVWRGDPSRSRMSMALVLAVAAILLLSSVASVPEAWVFEVPFAAVFVALGIGILRGRDWARRSAIVVGVALALCNVVATAPTLSANDRLLTWVVSVLVFPISLALYGVSRETRTHFTALRTARTRSTG